MNREIIKILLSVICLAILIAFALMGLFSTVEKNNLENKIEGLEKQIEQQTMLIEILKKSCEEGL